MVNYLLIIRSVNFEVPLPELAIVPLASDEEVSVALDSCENIYTNEQWVIWQGEPCRVLRGEYKKLSYKEFEDYTNITHDAHDNYYTVKPEWRELFT